MTQSSRSSASCRGHLQESCRQQAGRCNVGLCFHAFSAMAMPASSRSIWVTEVLLATVSCRFLEHGASTACNAPIAGGTGAAGPTGKFELAVVVAIFASLIDIVFKFLGVLSMPRPSVQLRGLWPLLQSFVGLRLLLKWGNSAHARTS